MSNELPANLLGAMRYFADPDVCVEFVAAMRWPNGAVCPHCQGERVSFLKSRRIWKCMAKNCHKQFSVKTQSVFEDSPIPLDKWMAAVWMVVNCKNGVSSYEIARSLGVTQKSAWFMLHRIRLALRKGNWEKMGGNGAPVEVDEVYLGGNEKNRHKKKGPAFMIKPDYWWMAARPADSRQGKKDKKTPVVGLLDRETRQVRAQVVPNVTRKALSDMIVDSVEKGGKIYSDAFPAYKSLPTLEFVHETVNHMQEYVHGDVHTNGIENFWSLLKRGLKGTYVAVEPFHLDRYLDEQIFRFNNRATKNNPLNDRDRFMLAVSQIYGKRITYAELTGKGEETQTPAF
ncbi:MAG TPA: IS1595 family transposase [Terracidiphilus sp.]|nr:IS1595 family transposase [Terracidiphilus sp.]